MLIFLYEKEAMIVGLSGGIASGKSTVAAIFATLGADIIDADPIARQLREPHSHCYNAIVARFGKIVVLDNGRLDTHLLRQIIFNDEQQRLWLNHLMHQQILREMKRQTSLSPRKYVVWVVPLLFELGWDRYCVLSISIDVSEQRQIERLMQRDAISQDLAQKMIASQMKRDERNHRAQILIDNDSDIAHKSLYEQVITVHREILALLEKG